MTPEPRPDERAALVEALTGAVVASGDPERTAWWREGVRENLGEPPEREP